MIKYSVNFFFIFDVLLKLFLPGNLISTQMIIERAVF